jgi:hypothetical protein
MSECPGVAANVRPSYDRSWLAMSPATSTVRPQSVQWRTKFKLPFQISLHVQQLKDDRSNVDRAVEELVNADSTSLADPSDKDDADATPEEAVQTESRRSR